MIRVVGLTTALILVLSGCAQGASVESAAPTFPVTSSAPAPSSSPASVAPAASTTERVAVVLPAPLDTRLPGQLLGEVGQERGESTRTWYAAVEVPDAYLLDFLTMSADALREQGYEVQQGPVAVVGTHPLEAGTPMPAPQEDAGTADNSAEVPQQSNAWVRVTVLDSQYPPALAEGKRYVSVTVVERLPGA